LPLIKGLDSGVKRISEVVSEVINVSRIASGTLQLSLGPVRLAEIVERVTARLSDIFAKRNLQLEIDDFSHLPVIQADGVQLEIALRNVLGNAIKYTPDGGKITVSGRLMGDAVDLVVRDTGIGIPAEEQRRIFDQFYVLEAIEHHSTSKSAFQGGGLGLGLAITKGIVEAHNGRIWVKSRSRNPEQLPGSAFHILLPVAQSHG
jgi:signal transduction histidine kinase